MKKLITPEIALEILKNNSRNRKFDKEVVLFYSDQMNKNIWKYNGESIIISSENELLDGQHRLAAVVKSKKSQYFEIIEGIDGSVFDTIDTGKNRTFSDMMYILDIKNATRISSIISSYTRLKNNRNSFSEGYKRAKLSKTEMMAIYNENPNFWINIYEISKTLYEKFRLLKLSQIGGYISFLIVDKNHNEEKVVSFFNQLILDKNIDNSTIPLLREKLLKSALGQIKLTDQYKNAIICKTWNNFVKGKQNQKLMYDPKIEEIPVFI